MAARRIVQHLSALAAFDHNNLRTIFADPARHFPQVIGLAPEKRAQFLFRWLENRDALQDESQVTPKAGSHIAGSRIQADGLA